MRDKTAEQTAAAVAVCLPPLEAQARGLVFEIPSHDYVLQAPDGATVKDRSPWRAATAAAPGR
jgi:hypothetical protein